jgi:glycosyltransferase involved in cell wall biosynthesis
VAGLARSSEERISVGLRVLLLTYFYPPLGGAGVQRSLKFSRYLPDFGLTPTVICADTDGYPHDPSLLAEIPQNVAVIRIPHSTALSRILALRQRWRLDPSHGTHGQPGAEQLRSARAFRWRDRVLSTWAALHFPDDKANWSRAAARIAMHAMAVAPIDIVLSSSPPISAHLTAWRVARRVGVPWVADFRDLWTNNPAYTAPAWRRSLDKRLEQRLLTAADGVVTVSAPFEAELMAAVRSNVPTVVIPNGYDEDDFAPLHPTPSDPDKFRVIHAGTFYGPRSPEPFLIGVQHWLEQHPELRNRLRIRFIGAIGSRFDAAINAFAVRWPGVLELGGYIDHSKMLAELVAADALLLVVGSGDATGGWVPGKLFEYLRAGQPILVLGSGESEVARLVRDSAAGEVVEEDRIHEVGAVLDRWVLDGDLPKPDPARATPYERKLLSRRLADFLFAVYDHFHLDRA